MNRPPDIARFVEKAQGASAQVEWSPDRLAALARAAELAAGAEPASLAAAGLSPRERQALAGHCAAAGVELLEGDLRARAQAIGAGLTPAAWGVAETGTLVVDSVDEDLRLCSMLPERHIALLPAEKVAPDLESISGELDSLMARRPGYLAFITGPSRTADIERVLTIGVHGPADLFILLIGEEQS